MARVVDLTGENVSRKRRKDRQYGTKTDLSSTTVDRGDTHWMNSSRVSIDGVLDVTGLTTISGTLNVSGTTTLSGSTTIAGPTGITGALTIAGSTDITGPLTVQGVTTISGELDVTGDTTISGALGVDGTLNITGTTTLAGVTTLKNDLNVTTGGKIKAGNIEIRPDAGGQIAMQGGAIGSDGLGMGLVNQTGIQISSPNTKITDLPTTSVAKANVHIDSSGRLWKVTNP
jgi:hypothetical protein